MGLIINPRGTAGAGKTEFVRRILADYGWGQTTMEIMEQQGRNRPLAYRLCHPAGGCPLVVVGHYEGTCGGCDTIPGRDGGLDRVIMLADSMAGAGCDVLLEGLQLSTDHHRSADLARRHQLHVLRLDTPLERCVRHLLVRRRAGAGMATRLAVKVAREAEALDAACARLAMMADVECLSFENALAKARRLLDLESQRSPAFGLHLNKGAGSDYLVPAAAD